MKSNEILFYLAIRFIGAAVGFLLFSSAVLADRTWEFAVQVSATIQTNPPQITLNWPQDTLGTPSNYFVYRKTKEATSWGVATTLPGSQTTYVDNNVSVGSAYEYQIYKTASWHNGYGYIYAGISAPLIESRGKLILIVDSSFSTALSNELARLTQDLIGDGWTVLRHDVSRSDSVQSVKNLIVMDYNADPANVRSVFLFGHIPVPYSGNIAPDGHPEHTGAWPADLFYAEMNSAWTDNSVNNSVSEDSRNWNVPGDGKFDQSLIPSTVELEIGRVDLANMPGRKTWNGPPTFPNETELLRNYLNKDHNFRHRILNPVRRALIHDGVGDANGSAFAACGWRNYVPFFGTANVRLLLDNEFLPVLKTNSYLCAYACDGSDYHSMASLGGSGNYDAGTTTDLYEADLRACFVMFLGSHFGDWDVEDDFMRVILALPSYGLTCFYAGSPHWFCHHMAMGETIGYSTRLTQNNLSNGLYRNTINQAAGQVHIALMGDPALRLHPVAPPGNLTATFNSSGAQLNWTASPDSVAGYHVYRAASSAGPFTRLTTGLVTGLSFTDTNLNGGTYMVRAVKLESSASGTYFNPSQGIFVNVAAVFVPNILNLTRTGTLSWSSVPGKTYRVVYKNNLADPNWTELTGNIVATGSVTSASVAGGVSQRFYRVLVVP